MGQAIPSGSTCFVRTSKVVFEDGAGISSGPEGSSAGLQAHARVVKALEARAAAEVAREEERVSTLVSTATVAASSIVLWAGVIAAGRLLVR